MRTSPSRRPRGAAAGFTLIELILVVIILTVLAALVVPQFSGRTEEAREAAADTQINSHFATALQTYEADVGRFPTTDQGLQALRSRPTSEPAPSAEQWKGPYLSKAVPDDPWGKPYQYEMPGTHNTASYDLWSAGPDGQSGTEDDITNWASDGS